MFLALVAAVVPIVVGLFVVRRQRIIGVMLMLHGLSVGAILAPGPGTDSRAGLVIAQLSQGAWVFLFLWIALVAYLLPDGRFASPRWHRWVGGWLLGVPVFLIGAAGDTGPIHTSHGGVDPPLPWLSPAVSMALGLVGLLCVVLGLFGSVVAVAQRLRRSTGEERRQLLWLVLGAVPVPITLLAGWTHEFVLHTEPGRAFDAILLVLATALPVCIGIAVLRHRLFDIELVLSRTLVYLTLLLLAVGVYVVVLALTDRLFGDSRAGGVLAVAVVAIAVHPAYSLVRSRIERWVYGFRSAPQEAIRLLAERAETADPHRLVQAVTEAVREAVKAKSVAIGPRGDGVPITYRGEHLGDLVVAMPEGHTLSGPDEVLLHDLAQYAAVLVMAESLNAELRESRSQIVAGREEERRRLRRDLHDGVGPSLAAIVLKLNAAQTRDDVQERNTILVETREEARAAIAEIRRLVDDLRPPAIDEVGLVAAIRQRAAALSGDVAFEVTGTALQSLPAAVEVAAYRIGTEAMTNVVRHSGASRCRVELTRNGSLVLTVSDNGRGEVDGTGGVGWSSMRARAAELGGSCVMIRRPEGGLVVRAVLPLGETGEVRA